MRNSSPSNITYGMINRYFSKYLFLWVWQKFFNFFSKNPHYNAHLFWKFHTKSVNNKSRKRKCCWSWVSRYCFILLSGEKTQDGTKSSREATMNVVTVAMRSNGLSSGEKQESSGETTRNHVTNWKLQEILERGYNGHHKKSKTLTLWFTAVRKWGESSREEVAVAFFMVWM